MKFREHRGGLAESMATMVEMDDPFLILRHIRRLFPKVREIEAHPYACGSDGRDDRIGWTNVHIVTSPGFGVLGFTDGPLKI